MSRIAKKKIQPVGKFGLLGCWLCIPLDADKKEVVKCAKDRAALSFDEDLIKDRLYGGFKCSDPNKRHVFISAGQFTYLGKNRKLEPQDRFEQWYKLLKENPDHFIGGGLFSEDAPNNKEI